MQYNNIYIYTLSLNINNLSTHSIYPLNDSNVLLHISIFVFSYVINKL